MEIVLSASPRRNILQGTIEFFEENWRDLSNKIEQDKRTEESITCTFKLKINTPYDFCYMHINVGCTTVSELSS